MSLIVRLGILTQYYPPETGAPQARLSGLARQFAARGHDVRVLTAMPNYPGGKIFPGYGRILCRETLDGVGVIRSYVYATNRVQIVPRMANYCSFAASSLAVGAALLPKLDYVMTESPPLFLGVPGYLLSRMKGARWIFNISDLWPESAVRLGVIGSGVALDAAYRLEEWCYRKAWLVSGQSKGILADIRSRYPDVRTYHLSNGVDTKLFTADTNGDELRRVMAEPGECIFLYAGLHGIAQGLGQVLDAARILDGRLQARFVFIGAGPAKGELIREANRLRLGNVRFLDPMPNARIAAAMRTADVAIVPLKVHLPGAIPSKLYEAMAAGVPVVLAGDGEPAEIVRETGCGATVSPGDCNGLADELERLARDPVRRAECGGSGRRAAVARFDRQSIAEAFVRYLENELHVTNL